MTRVASSGFLMRTLQALKRGILGKSSREFSDNLTGSDGYWEKAIAARSGWPQKDPRKSEDGDKGKGFGAAP